MTPEYYAANREKVLAYQRAYYQANRERKLKAVQQRRLEQGEAGLARRREQARRWRDLNPGRARQAQVRYHLRQRYGIDEEAYRELLIGQAGRCLICGLVPDDNLRVDHDHTTGKVRGLLCNSCNYMLGFARDVPERLRSAAAYLDRSR